MNPKFRLAVGGDHAGFAMKAPLIEFLRREGHTIEDGGSYDPAPVDCPDISRAGVRARARRARRPRILICGSDVGACIAANKVPGIRATLCHDIYCAHQSVEHDDVNVACIGALVVGQKVAEDCLRAFLAAEFSTEPHFRAGIEKLNALERWAAQIRSAEPKG